jgi:hypothetical protein
VDLAPEFPALDGDSGKTAGVAVRFMSLRSKPLKSAANLKIFMRLKQRTRRASRARPPIFIVLFQDRLVMA